MVVAEKVTFSTVWYGECRNSTGNLATDKLFTGQRLDDTGLYYYGARYYDPTIGRFISADTIVQTPANPQSLNRYSYVFNNPLKYNDPTGHVTFGIGLNVFLGFLGNVSASKMFVFDFKGGARFVDCTELGVAGGASASMSLMGQFTTADSVDDLLGTSKQIGANAGPWGAEYIAAEKYWGENIMFGLGIGADIHVNEVTTEPMKNPLKSNTPSLPVSKSEFVWAEQPKPAAPTPFFTASARELDSFINAGVSKESPKYQNVVDWAFSAAQSKAEETGGIVSWSSSGGYSVISAKQAASYYYDDIW